MAKTNPTRASQKIGFWHAVRDISMKSIDKGQFPLVIIGAIVIVILIKLPAEDISYMTKDLYDSMKTGYFVGYFLSVILAGGWVFHLKSVQNVHAIEMDRVSKEKSELQEALAARQLSSTKAK